MNEFDNSEMTREEIERKERDNRRIYMESQLEELKEEARIEAEKEERKQEDKKHFWNVIFYTLLVLIVLGIGAYLFAKRDLIWP